MYQIYASKASESILLWNCSKINVLSNESTKVGNTFIIYNSKQMQGSIYSREMRYTYIVCHIFYVDRCQ